MFFHRVGTCLIALAMWLGGSLPAAAWCVRGVESWDTLRIRAAPVPHARQIGAIPFNACGVAIVGGCRGAWCPVVFRGRSGWSNAGYLIQGDRVASLGWQGWRLFAPPRAAMPLAPPPRVARAAPSQRQAGAAMRPAGKRVAALPRRGAPPARDVVRDAEPAPPRVAIPAPPPQPPSLPPAPPVQATPPPAPTPPAVPQAAPAAPPIAGAAVVLPPAKVAPPAAGSEACVVNVAKGDTLKVRAGPGLDQTLRFGFPAGACGIKMTGPCKDGWCPIDYRGYRGWAEQKFLK